MNVAVTCFCGERFSAPDYEAGQMRRCPSCGEMVTVPQARSGGLSSAQFLNMNYDDDLEARADMPTCPDCKGTGVCQTCTGLKKGLSRVGQSSQKSGSFIGISWVGSFLKLLGMDTVQCEPEYCLSCNGKGKCYKCKGHGMMTDQSHGV